MTESIDEWKGFKTIIALCLLSLAVGAYFSVPSGKMIRWVGSKDFEITFVVTDADTQQPVEGSQIQVLSEGCNFCSDRGKAPFTLVTDANGAVKHLSENCMCFGAYGWSSGSRIDTFAIHIPDWFFKASAKGYEDCEPVSLGAQDNQQRVQRGKDVARLNVPVHLKRLADSGKE